MWIFFAFVPLARLRNMRKEFKTKKDIKDLDHITILNKAINKENIQDFENLCVFVKLTNPSELNNLIKSLDSTFGYISDESIEPIKNKIKLNEEFFNLNCMFAQIQPDVDLQIFTKLFTYQNFLSRIPKLKDKLEKTIGILDFVSISHTDKIVQTHLDSILALLN